MIVQIQLQFIYSRTKKAKDYPQHQESEETNNLTSITRNMNFEHTLTKFNTLTNLNSNFYTSKIVMFESNQSLKP